MSKLISKITISDKAKEIMEALPPDKWVPYFDLLEERANLSTVKALVRYGKIQVIAVEFTWPSELSDETVNSGQIPITHEIVPYSEETKWADSGWPRYIRRVSDSYYITTIPEIAELEKRIEGLQLEISALKEQREKKGGK